jgi:methanogenic corrinoid protein MtbC1
MAGATKMNPSMGHDSYPLRTVSQLTGLSPDVIRAWERRYGVVTPGRGPRGARLYSAADVAFLRLLRRVVESGRAIGDVARLSAADLQKLADAAVPSEDAAPDETDDRRREIIRRALEAVNRFDLDSLERHLGHVLVALGSAEFIRTLAGPLMHEVGTRWENGRISIAEEHFIAGVMRNLLASLLRSRGPAQDGAVLLATPPGERHEIGILLAAMIIADAGFKVYYLGIELPSNEVVEAARRSRAVLIGIGLVNGENRKQATASVRTMEESLPGHAELWLGGRAAPAVARELGTTRALVIPDLPTMDREIRRLRTRVASGLDW